jgi:hypothetical protein
MDSEPKKAEIDWEAKFWQEMDDEISPSAGDDEIEREDAMYNMFIEELKYLDLPELEEKERAGVEKNSILESEDTDEDDEEEYEDDDEIGKICNARNWCGRA